MVVAGAAALIAVVSLVWAQGSATPTPTSPRMMATVDRLAAPPTVQSPTQADDGAQLFWLYCQPCHGDRGQGLTDEWRSQYPPEDRNCWARGCHGNVPYENGFTLPETVPALIGQGSLAKFDSLGQLYAFVRAAMPFEAPGSLGDEEYLSIIAYLARAHGVWDGSPLNANSVFEVQLSNDQQNANGNQAGSHEDGNSISVTSVPEADNGQTNEGQDDLIPPGAVAIVIALGVVVLLIGGGLIWRRRTC
jgi:mono/diheme cytochrome c family protein